MKNCIPWDEVKRQFGCDTPEFRELVEKKMAELGEDPNSIVSKLSSDNIQRAREEAYSGEGTDEEKLARFYELLGFRDVKVFKGKKPS